MFFDYKQKHPDNLTLYGRIRDKKKNIQLQNSTNFINRKESLQDIKVKTNLSEKDILSPFLDRKNMERTKKYINRQTINEKENDFENYRTKIDNKLIRIFGNNESTARLANKECANLSHIRFQNGVMASKNNEKDLEKIIKKKQILDYKNDLLKQIEHKRLKKEEENRKMIEEQKREMIRMEKARLKQEIENQKNINLESNIINKNTENIHNLMQSQKAKKVTFQDFKSIKKKTLENDNYQNKNLENYQSQNLENSNYCNENINSNNNYNSMDINSQILKNVKREEDPLYNQELALKIQKNIIKDIDEKLIKFQHELTNDSKTIKDEIINLKNMTLDIQYKKNLAENEIKNLRTKILNLQYDDEIRTNELIQVMSDDNYYKILPTETFFRTENGNIQDMDYFDKNYIKLDNEINGFNRDRKISSKYDFIPIGKYENVFEDETFLKNDLYFDEKVFYENKYDEILDEDIDSIFEF